jgi:two-component system, cell cycle sensor histidine kinase and response regulator CckA
MATTVPLLQRSEPRTAPFLLLMLVVMAALFGGGAWLYQRETARIHDARVGEIESIATLKVSQLTTWRGERLMDARFGARGPYFVRALDEWERGEVDASRRAAYESRLADYISMLRYDHVFLLDREDRVAYAFGNGAPELAPAEIDVVHVARKARDAVMSEFFIVPGLGVRVTAVAPVLDGERQVGTVLLRRDPERLIFPMLASRAAACRRCRCASRSATTPCQGFAHSSRTGRSRRRAAT